MKIIVPLSIFVLSTSLAYAEIIVDVTKIAGKTQKQVAGYLGKETSCSKSKYGRKCLYKKGKTEIVFINGKADWITVDAIDNILFSTTALGSLGLKKAAPSFKNSFTLRWESIQGLSSVSIFKGTSTSDYAYIIVKTK